MAVAAWADNSVPAFPDCDNPAACARNSVVSVLPVWPPDKARSEEPEGSGVVVGDDGLIATANHVLGEARNVFVRSFSGKVVRAEILLRDQETDIALLKAVLNAPPAELAPAIVVGSKACAIGNGFGLGLSLTCGVVSAKQMSGVGFNRIEDFVQTDAAVNPGMSGGALVNDKGQLIGLLSAIFTKTSDSNIGVNFAVSAPLLMKVVADYQEHGRTVRIAPGLLLRPALKTGDTGLVGAQVMRVEVGSAEEAAGVQRGDIILFAGGRRIKRAGAYLAALALLQSGAPLELDIMRDGARKTIKITFKANMKRRKKP